MPTVPSAIPSKLTIGDIWAWAETITGFPPSDYTLTYYFNQLSGGTPFGFDIEGEEDGEQFAFEQESGDVAGLVPGRYRWSARMESNEAGEYNQVIKSGEVEILPDPATTGADTRSINEQILDAINAAILGMATTSQMEYSINTPQGSRSIKKMDGTELLKWKTYYENLVNQERRRREGKSNGQIQVRFERP